MIAHRETRQRRRRRISSSHPIMSCFGCGRLTPHTHTQPTGMGTHLHEKSHN
ncbi:hypothetical protein RDWZM_009169, partial [Blomia tropicalis]